MRGIVLLLALVSVSMTTQAATAIGTPALKVVDRTPLTIEGRGFAARHDVTVIVQAPGVSERRTLRIGESGRFRVAIARLSLTGRFRCGNEVMIAARSTASGLVLWHQVMPNCPAPLRPPAVVTR